MSTMMGSPFETFEMIRVMPLRLGSTLDLTMTNSTIYLAMALLMYTLAYSMNIENGLLVPTRWQTVLEMVYSQMVSMVQDNIGDGSYVPLIWTMFMNLTLMKLVGLVPYTFTPTAHMVMGLGMSVSMLMAVTYMGIENYGSNYLAMMMPGGSPMMLAGFLVVMEFMSQLAKGVSLGVRLAANMTAGHLLFAMLSGFTWTMLTSGSPLAVLSMFPMLMVVFITVLELAVAMMQAYVFSMLTSMYINDAMHIH